MKGSQGASDDHTGRKTKKKTGLKLKKYPSRFKRGVEKLGNSERRAHSAHMPPRPGENEKELQRKF